MPDYRQFMAHLVAASLLVVFSAVPAVAGMVIITETDQNITVEYTGGGSSPAHAPRVTEIPPDKSAAIAPGVRPVPPPPYAVPASGNPGANVSANPAENPNRPFDRRILRQARQRSMRVPDDNP